MEFAHAILSIWHTELDTYSLEYAPGEMPSFDYVVRTELGPLYFPEQIDAKLYLYTIGAVYSY